MNEQLAGLRRYYTTVLWQEMASDQDHLVASCKSGCIHIFNLKDALDSFEHGEEQVQEFPQSVYSFNAHKDAVYGFASSSKLLFSAGKGEIKCWSWLDVVKKDVKNPLWSVEIPTSGDVPFKSEINALVFDSTPENQKVIAGCGDNRIYGFDLELRKNVMTLNGHSDYVNCLKLSSDAKTLYSGSEDGSIRVWDLRSNENVQTVEPHKHQELNRPAFGKHISTLALDPDSEWLVTGGGPLLSSWNLRFLAKGVHFETPPTESLTNVVLLHDDLVVAGGSNPFVYVWEFNGKLMSQIPTSAHNIFSIAINERSNKTVLTVGGTSSKINVCSNFKYNDFSLMVA